MSSTMDHPTSAATGTQSAPLHARTREVQQHVGQGADADAVLDDEAREEAA